MTTMNLYEIRAEIEHFLRGGGFSRAGSRTIRDDGILPPSYSLIYRILPGATFTARIEEALNAIGIHVSDYSLNEIELLTSDDWEYLEERKRQMEEITPDQAMADGWV